MQWLPGGGTCLKTTFAVFVASNSTAHAQRANTLVMTVLCVCCLSCDALWRLELIVVVIGTCGHSFHMVRHKDMIDLGTRRGWRGVWLMIQPALSFDVDTTRFLERTLSDV